MTETEFFKAIHQYADEVEFYALDGHNDDPDARAKLLVAIVDYAFQKTPILRAKASAFDAWTTPRPRAEWSEDDGPVLWWQLPVSEPPYAGTPLDDEFPDYETHWTPIPELSHQLMKELAR